MSETNLQSPKAVKPPIFTKSVRNNTDLRKMSTTKQIYRTPFPSKRKKVRAHFTKTSCLLVALVFSFASSADYDQYRDLHCSLFSQPPPHYRFHYDPEVKGWRETQKVTATTRWNKAKDAVRVGNYFIGIRKKPDTFLNIDVKKLVEATKKNHSIQTARKTKEVSMAEESDVDSLERTLTEPTVLAKPFIRDSNQPSDRVWTCPVSIRAKTERAKQFNWERPKTERKVLVESASKYQAIYLQKLLKEKDREIKLITNQLIKSNKENVTLLKELEGYRGKNYDELYKENITLKEQIARACRENVMLAGQWKRDNNRTLQKLSVGRQSIA